MLTSYIDELMMSEFSGFRNVHLLNELTEKEEIFDEIWNEFQIDELETKDFDVHVKDEISQRKSKFQKNICDQMNKRPQSNRIYQHQLQFAYLIQPIF